MHMADALISPEVGLVMAGATVMVASYSIKKVDHELEEKKLPIMGVMGAFVFAAQMINFTIPGTGSSGHLGGGVLLAAILGPFAGFLTMAAILLIQALFFGDGGLLAYGCNVMNLGFLTCFVVYPLLYRRIIKGYASKTRIFSASLIAAIIGLQLGSLGVVLETVLSGRTTLPASLFLMMMQSIHLAIGIVEGLVTAFVVSFLYAQRPDILFDASVNQPVVEKGKLFSRKRIALVFLILALFVGGIFSHFASANPDGLEWSLEKAMVDSQQEEDAPEGVYQLFSKLQEKTAFLPDYDFREKEEYLGGAGTSASGVLGALITFGVAVLSGLLLRRVKRKKNAGVN